MKDLKQSLSNVNKNFEPNIYFIIIIIKKKLKILITSELLLDEFPRWKAAGTWSSSLKSILCISTNKLP